MAKVAVLDDWQGVARSSTDWSPLIARGCDLLRAGVPGRGGCGSEARRFRNRAINAGADAIPGITHPWLASVAPARHRCCPESLPGHRCLHRARSGWSAIPSRQARVRPQPPNWRSACCWRPHALFPPLMPTCAPDVFSRACLWESAWREKRWGLSASGAWAQRWPAIAARLTWMCWHGTKT
jgi:hypothetical protein